MDTGFVIDSCGFSSSLSLAKPFFWQPARHSVNQTAWWHRRVQKLPAVSKRWRLSMMPCWSCQLRVLRLGLLRKLTYALVMLRRRRWTHGHRYWNLFWSGPMWNVGPWDARIQSSPVGIKLLCRIQSRDIWPSIASLSYGKRIALVVSTGRWDWTRGCVMVNV